LETKNKRKNGATSSEMDKKRWLKNRLWRKKKAKNEQLASLVKEISLTSNAFHHLIVHPFREIKFTHANINEYLHNPDMYVKSI
jgi:hypothetical protein